MPNCVRTESGPVHGFITVEAIIADIVETVAQSRGYGILCLPMQATPVRQLKINERDFGGNGSLRPSAKPSEQMTKIGRRVLYLFRIKYVTTES